MQYNSKCLGPPGPISHATGSGRMAVRWRSLVVVAKSLKNAMVRGNLVFSKLTCAGFRRCADGFESSDATQFLAAMVP
jgi:hypothetical protein